MAQGNGHIDHYHNQSGDSAYRLLTVGSSGNKFLFVPKESKLASSFDKR